MFALDELYVFFAVFALAVVMSLFLIALSVRSRKLSGKKLRKNKFSADYDSASGGKELDVAAKTDERLLEAGDVEITAVSIDGAGREFYQNLGNKAKQDAAVDLLQKAAEENLSRHENNRQHLKNYRQEQKRRADRELENKRQLEKLRGVKVKRKVAKKIARENIRLDDEQIKKIKIKSLGGKLK